jgi:hypothetical protein
LNFEPPPGRRAPVSSCEIDPEDLDHESWILETRSNKASFTSSGRFETPVPTAWEYSNGGTVRTFPLTAEGKKDSKYFPSSILREVGCCADVGKIPVASTTVISVSPALAGEARVVTG